MLITINNFLIDHSGITAELVQNYLEGRNTTTFFKPYQSPADFAQRVTYVVSAPLFLSVIFLEVFALAIGAALKSISYDLVVHGKQLALFTAGQSLSLLVNSIVIAALAFASPFINLVDLAGGGVNTIKKYNQEQNTATSIPAI